MSTNYVLFSLYYEAPELTPAGDWRAHGYNTDPAGNTAIAFPTAVPRYTLPYHLLHDLPFYPCHIPSLELLLHLSLHETFTDGLSRGFSHPQR